MRSTPARLRLVRTPLAVLVVLASGCSSSPRYAPSAPQAPARPHIGVASWYGGGFHGKATASGERFDKNGFTAAHRSLPLGTRARVTNLANGRSVVVRINDRGPFVRGRVLDLSHGAARALSMARGGTGRVRIEVLGPTPLRPRTMDARVRKRNRPQRSPHRRAASGTTAARVVVK